MSARFVFLALCLPALGFAQGDPKPNASDYPANASVDRLSVGAEYLGHTFFVDNAAYDAGDFLVIDIALYPRAGETPDLKWSWFSVRYNGKRDVIPASPPGHVEISQRLAPWNENRKGVVVAAGAGQGGIVLGQPQVGPRFPGDPSTGGPRMPRAPAPEYDRNVEREPVDFGDLVRRATIPEGPLEKPRRGYLFFPYSGKLAKLHSIDLVVSLGAAEISLQVKRKK